VVRGETIMPVPSGKITTTKIMQGLDPEPEVKEEEEKKE
jgi:hypothetical protein